MPLRSALSHDTADLEREVLALVTRLVHELRGPAGGSVALDQSLERELGISSLERVELMTRLERAFGVRLPDAVMAGAESPRALVTALRAARTQDVVTEPAEARTLLTAEALSPPPSARTLVEALRWHVDQHPERQHLVLREEDGRETPLSFGALWSRASAVAEHLRDRGVGRGDTVAIMLRTEQAFFSTFFGALLAGAVPVPLYPPFRADRLEEYVTRQIVILRNASARALVTFAEVEPVTRLLRGQVPSLTAVVRADEISGDPMAGLKAGATAAQNRLHGDGSELQFDAIADDLALIQYTSGSTGDPKGVALSHANLLANIRSIGKALEVRDGDVTVSWLPLYHDMGLIGAWLGPLYFGMPLALMSPLAFLSRPSRWLRALEAHRGTISPAPNFAFDLAARKIPDEELEGLDLSSVRLLLNGAEAVMPETIQRFTARFRRFGFKPEALCPVYGLAECSVGLTCSPMSRLPRIDPIERRAFQESGRAVSASADDTTALAFVSAGRPMPDQEIRLVDDEGHSVGERVKGRIQFRGPSVTRGYYQNPDATKLVLGSDGWMDSGDLGYLADGEVFITGRRKDLIIKAGRNLYPQEVEEITASVPGVRAGCVAAFGASTDQLGTEQLVIIAETRETDEAGRAAISAAVIERVATVLGVPPDHVILARPGAVLKTSSGKVRRSATRDAWLSGRLDAQRSSSWQIASLALRELGARAGRLAAATGRALYTSYVLALLILGVPFLLAATASSPPRVRQIFKSWCGWIVRLGRCRLHVDGDLDRRRSGATVFVANHASYIDVIVLVSQLPADTIFVAKRGLSAYPLIGTIIRRAGYVTVEKADFTQRMEGADALTDRLRQGATVVVFPEGTFVRASGLLPFRLGAFHAAAQANATVVPIALRGTRRFFPDGAWLLNPLPLTLTVGPDLRAADSTWEEIVRIRDAAREFIAEHVGEDFTRQG